MDYPIRLVEAAGDLFTQGLLRSDPRTAREWEALLRRGQQLGFHRLSRMVERIASGLDSKLSVLHWDSESTARAVLDLLVAAHLAAERSAVNP